YQTMGDLEAALAALADGPQTSIVPQALARPESIPPSSNTTAQRAIDMAKVVLGGSIAPAASAKDAKLARPTIAVASGLIGLWFVGGLTSALAGLVRILHDGEITGTECVLLVVGCLVATATPLALYVLHVKRTVWPNSVRALALATDLKRTAVAA